MLGLGLIALTLSFVAMVNKIDPTLRQLLKRDVLVPHLKGFAYPVQD
jgi:hypothetical protein